MKAAASIRRAVARGNCAGRWFAAVLATIAAAHAATADAQQQVPQFPQYQVQNPPPPAPPARPPARFRSGIMTSDGRTFWDNDFANLVNGVLAPGGQQVVHEAGFAFMECFGGGMIDDLESLLVHDSYTSAARHNQPAWAGSEDPGSAADPLFPAVHRVESFYNVPYTTTLRGGATLRASAMAGYNGDMIGPPRLAASQAAFPRLRGESEVPQYTGDAIGDSITLHRNNPADPGTPNTRYRVILFGGSTQLDPTPAPGPALKINPNPLVPYIFGQWAINWNTLNRIHDSLLALGFTEDEMYIMYPGGQARNAMGAPTGRVFPGGPALPAWIDAGTRAADLTSAWNTWLAPQVNASTQVYFWSSWGHGNRGPDAAQQRRQAGGQVQRGTPMSFDADADFGGQANALFNLYSGGSPDGNSMTPYFEVDSSMAIADLSITLNSHPLSLLDAIPDALGDGSEWLYKFSLDQTDISAMMASLTQSLTVNYSSLLPTDATFITSMGPTLGDFANGLSFVPEPATILLLAIAVALLRGRRATTWLGGRLSWNRYAGFCGLGA